DHLEPPDPVAARPLVRLGAGQLGDDLPAGRAAVGVALDRLALRPVEAAAHQLDEALVIRAWSGTGRHPATLYTGRVGMSETELDAAVTDLLARGAGAWPDLAPDAGRMRALARARLAASAGDPAAAAALRAEDLYLALACLAGDERAHAGFDRLLSDTAGAALGRMGASATERAEVIQEVRARLLVAPPAPGDGAPPPEPRLAEYAGRGDLRVFVRAVAVRTFLNARRGTRREVLPDDQAVLDRMAEGSADPDLALMRARYRGDFARAFGAAVDRLPERE